MPEAVLQPLLDALDRASNAGRSVRFWLRDDDAVSPTPALSRLTALCEAHDVPVLLAVIPEPAGEALAEYVARHPLLTPAQHGYRHANHAAQGERAREVGGARDAALVFDELAEGQRKMRRLFGPDAARILVPPWNRIDPALVPILPRHGFDALSTFGPVLEPVPGLTRINCDLDIIDWRNGRVGRAHTQLVARLAELVRDRLASSAPIGLLSHHLAHDETAWTFLDICLAGLRTHPAAVFKPFATIT